MDQAKCRIKKLNKSEKGNIVSPVPERLLSPRRNGPLHDKLLCVWCMKPEDIKHRRETKLSIIQQLKAWHTFKSHTVHLTDKPMRDKIITLISSTPDPFAAEIRYHKTCWNKYIHPVYNHDDDGSIHLQDVCANEVKELFLKHVRTVIFERNEPRTLQGLLLDYKHFLNNFGHETGVMKSSAVKDIIQNEFGNGIGFHARYLKNESTIVYDASQAGSYVESAIYSWGISDDQLFNTCARRLRERIVNEPGIKWPPTVEEVTNVEEPDLLLQRFLTWLVGPEVKTFETCSNPVIVTLASLLKSFICGKRTLSKVKLSITLHGLTRSREIIDICKKLGLGISYSDVLQLHSAWTKYEEEQDNCPREIAYNTSGTAVMDNDDFQDDTLTGSNTSHRTNVK